MRASGPRSPSPTPCRCRHGRPGRPYENASAANPGLASAICPSPHLPGPVLISTVRRRSSSLPCPTAIPCAACPCPSAIPCGAFHVCFQLRAQFANLAANFSVLGSRLYLVGSRLCLVGAGVGPTGDHDAQQCNTDAENRDALATNSAQLGCRGWLYLRIRAHCRTPSTRWNCHVKRWSPDCR